MVNENRIVKTVYKAELDRASYRQVQQQIASQSKTQVKSAKDNLNINDDIRRSLLRQIDTQNKVNKGYRENTKELEKQVKAVDKFNDKFDKISRDVGLAGDAESALLTLSGALNTAGLDTGGLQLGGEILASVEALPRLRSSIEGLPQVAQVAADSIGVGGVGLAGAVAGFAVGAQIAAKQIQDATKEAVRELEKGLEAEFNLDELIRQGYSSDEIAKILDEQASKSQDAARRVADNEAKVADATDSLGRQLGDTFFNPDFLKVALPPGASDILAEPLSKAFGDTAASVVKAIDPQSTGFAAINESLERDRDIVTEYEQTLRRLNEAMADGRLATNDAVASAIELQQVQQEEYQLQQQVAQFARGASTEQLQQRLDDLQAEANALALQREAFAPLISESEKAKSIYDDLTDQIADVTAETELYNTVGRELINIREDERDATEAVKEAAKEREAIDRKRESTLKRLLSLEGQATDAIATFAEKQSELIIDRANRDADRLADFNDDRRQDEAELNRDLLQISRDGNKAITDARKAVSDFDKDYMRGQIKANQDYYDDLKKLNRQRDLQELQNRRDHILDLAEAEQSNSVIDFIRLENRFKNEQQKRRENESLEDRERREQLQKTLDDNRQAYLQRRSLLLEEVRERRNQLQQSIAEARDKFRIEQDLAQQAFDKQNARQARDDKLADERAQRALQKQLAAIQLKAQAELNGIQAVVGASSELVRVAQRISSLASSAGSRLSGSISGSTSIGSKSYEQSSLSRAVRRVTVDGRTSGFTAFAKGGIVKGGKPQIAVVGDTPRGIDEAIIPYRKSRGLRSALEDYGIFPRMMARAGNGATINAPVNLNFTVSDEGLKAEISDSLQTFATNFENQILRGLSNAVNQTG